MDMHTYILCLLNFFSGVYKVAFKKGRGRKEGRRDGKWEGKGEEEIKGSEWKGWQGTKEGKGKS